MAQQLGTVLFAARQHPWHVAGATVVVIGQGSAGMFWAWSLKRAGAARVIVADRVARPVGGGAAVRGRRGGRRAHRRPRRGRDGPHGGRRRGLRRRSRRSEGDPAPVDLAVPHRRQPVLVRAPRHERPGAHRLPLFFRRKLSAFSTYGAQAEPGLASFRAAVEHIRRGEIDVRPLLTHVLPIEEIEQGLRAGRPLRGRRAQGVDLVLTRLSSPYFRSPGRPSSALVGSFGTSPHPQALLAYTFWGAYSDCQNITSAVSPSARARPIRCETQFRLATACVHAALGLASAVPARMPEAAAAIAATTAARRVAAGYFMMEVLSYSRAVRDAARRNGRFADGAEPHKRG